MNDGLSADLILIVLLLHHPLMMIRFSISVIRQMIRVIQQMLIRDYIPYQKQWMNHRQHHMLRHQIHQHWSTQAVQLLVNSLWLVISQQQAKQSILTYHILNSVNSTWVCLEKVSKDEIFVIPNEFIIRTKWKNNLKEELFSSNHLINSF